MGTHVIKMPDIGEGIAEVELSVWHVKVGDLVVEDQVLADVMTDKAMVDIPSPVHGKVISLGGVPGEVMAVGSILISIEVEGAGNFKESSQPAPVAAKEAPVAAPPKVEAVAASKPVAAPRPAVCQGPMVARDADERPLASPAVRKHALDLGIQLRLVRGTGPAGRVLHEDLDAYLAEGQSNASTATAAYAQRTDEEQIPVIGMRRKIAQRMQDATQRAAHFSYVEEIDVTSVEELRTHLNEKHGASRGKLTLLPFLVRALVVALRDFPQINARYDDEAQVITRLGAVHVGVATQSDIGLMVPVVRHAEARSLWDSAQEISRLATAARNGKASRD